MKKIVPVIIAMASLMIAVSMANGQSRIHNPNLPNHLVFQWKFVADQVDPSWSNEHFSVQRTDNGLEVYYGAYKSLEEALTEVEHIEMLSKGKMELVPFFNQRSISAMDALVLMENKNRTDIRGPSVQSEVVSFTVYFGTYDRLLSSHELNGLEGDLSFEVNPNYTFAYAWGSFGSIEEAEQALARTFEMGFEDACVQRYLNGQKVAMVELSELYAYVEYVQKSH